MINVFQPSLGGAEAEAVAEVFASNWLGHGPRTEAFEAEFAAHLGAPASEMIFVNSATSGLYLAVDLLDLDAGDDVLMPSISFVGAANAVARAGARPVFSDVDPVTLNPRVEHLEAAVTPRTKAVVVLHYGGHPGDVAEIARWCRSRGLVLVEDAACAPASRVDGRACGTFADIAVWSFDAMKVLVTGDGGMVRVRDPELALRARRLAYHGLAQVSGYSAAASTSRRWWDLSVLEHGRRVVGNDVTAAIGSVQLRRLDGFVARRREIAGLYDELLADVPAVRACPRADPGHEVTHYFYWVGLPADRRDRVAADLLARGIYTTFRYAPLHRVPAYRADADLPGVEEAAARTLLLPIHQDLEDVDVRTVVGELERALEAPRTRAA